MCQPKVIVDTPMTSTRLIPTLSGFSPCTKFPEDSCPPGELCVFGDEGYDCVPGCAFKKPCPMGLICLKPRMKGSLVKSWGQSDRLGL